MAVTEALPGVEVTIEINGQALPELTDTDLEVEPKTMTRYVEAQSDTEFAVRIKVNPNTIFKSDCLRARISVDGTWADSPIFLKEDLGNSYFNRLKQGMSLPGGNMRPFRFSALETGQYLGKTQLPVLIKTSRRPSLFL
jgi:hypothetical protein